MARLTTKARKSLSSSTFAGPHRSFPIPDKGHAKAALALIGKAPPSARPKIRERAEEKLHGGKVPRGEHHQANHREPRSHAEFHQLGNPGGSSQGSSEDLANRGSATGIEAN